MNPELPPVTPGVLAAALESLTARLRKRLDAAIEVYAKAPVIVDGTTRRVRCGEDAEVTLLPGASNTLTDPDQIACTCLLAPRCLHRAAVLGSCPLADAPQSRPEPPTATGTEGGTGAARRAEPGAAGERHDRSEGRAEAGPERQAECGSRQRTEAGREVWAATSEPVTVPGSTATPAPLAAPGSVTTPASAASTIPASPSNSAAPSVPAVPSVPTPAQIAAAHALWSVAAAVLAAGIPAGGAVLQAELLRAAHTARLAGLYRAEGAARRVVRALRGARARHGSHRLARLVADLRDLLLTTGMLAAADPDPALVGVARRGYRQAGRLRVHGVCSEPVISATGYGGVVTHLVSDDGRWFSVADIKPGGPTRARRAATAAVAPGTGSLTHARLSRGGMLMAGATVSADGRLGSGKGVRATPVTGLPWTEGPLAALFSRPLSEAVAERLPPPAASDPEDAERRARALIGCDLILVGVAGDRLFARELPAGQPDMPGILLSLTPSSSHPDLCHAANFRRLASRPGLRLRVIGRLDADRAVTIRPLAVAPVPDGAATLRLPAEWAGHADLGYDRLEGMHLPPPDALSSADRLERRPTDPVADTPLWRLRRIVEAAVAGGRRTVAEPSRSGDGGRAEAALRGSGFRTAAELLGGLVTEADRRTRDVFGRADEPDPDRYARAWLAAAVHLAATERALVQAGWQPSAPAPGCAT
ncbi:hypothetical protein AB0929_29715 [Streptomyces massasporeus]|uniref:hypothetical protein n=1 Tax=Streptomyces massasporeus TaxID=67324 RepID=UPI003453CA8B